MYIIFDNINYFYTNILHSDSHSDCHNTSVGFTETQVGSRINLMWLYVVCIMYIDVKCNLPCTRIFCFMLFYLQELLGELNIPTVSISASRRLAIVQRQLLQKIQPLLTNRESLFQSCQPISYSLAHQLLLSSYKLHSAFGCWDPINVFVLYKWPLCLFF